MEAALGHMLRAYDLAKKVLGSHHRVVATYSTRLGHIYTSMNDLDHDLPTPAPSGDSLPFDAPVQDASAAAGGLDKIRDLLFGRELSDVDKRFARLEARLAEDASRIKRHSQAIVRDVLLKLKEVTEEVLKEEASKDADFKRVYESQQAFMETYKVWDTRAYVPADL